jgi:hypothetical protein
MWDSSIPFFHAGCPALSWIQAKLNLYAAVGACRGVERGQVF